MLLCTGCAHQQIASTSTELNYEKTALEFRDAGDHLLASYYLEAALDAQAQENVPTMKLLIEEQILAGRLLAARESLYRLEQREEAELSVRTLRMLIEQLVGLRVSKRQPREGE